VSQPAKPKGPKHRRLLLWLDPELLVTVGRGERGEAASEAGRAGPRAHPHDRGAADWLPGRGTAHADV